MSSSTFVFNTKAELETAANMWLNDPYNATKPRDNFLTWNTGACSAASCEELGWSNGERLGNRACVATLPGGCEARSTWAEAHEACARVGARLCTQREIAAFLDVSGDDTIEYSEFTARIQASWAI